MMSAYFAQTRPTYIENWSEAVKSLSLPQIDIPLTLKEAGALGANNREFSRWFPDARTEDVEKIAGKIDNALEKFPSGAFVRLGSRSGKDSTFANNRGLKITDGDSAVRMLTENSRRIAYDLRLALHHKYAPHIFLRQWLEIPRWAEFRCFMKDRQLVGISQYDCKNTGRSPEINESADRIRSAIETFFKEFHAASHLEDVVFDVFLEMNENSLNPMIKARLLELNPFCRKTDACLFDWEKDDFDKTFRYIR